MNEIKIKTSSSDTEQDLRKDFFRLFKECPIPDNEMLENLALFLKRQDLGTILFKQKLYENIIGTHGVVMEFGVRWGASLALFESFRGIFEPFNINRKIIGFDSFEGFPSVHEKDGNSSIISQGAYGVTDGYEKYLEQVLDYHETESPISHIKKYELVKGDAVVEIEKYLHDNPQTIIALAYFDFDIYEPTKKCLEAIKGHITKGTVIGFDELNLKDYQGETLALKEVFGLDRYRIVRTPYSSNKSYIVID
ncbi:crotonobetainyl-CoA--carnitine CoA-transferase [Alphaproteobacteria bacterium]|nr:crotonobetainyl-CoA--carnitine CoA-transferase [Alphaproteobacteria bacterium]